MGCWCYLCKRGHLTSGVIASGPLPGSQIWNPVLSGAGIAGPRQPRDLTVNTLPRWVLLSSLLPASALEDNAEIIPLFQTGESSAGAPPALGTCGEQVTTGPLAELGPPSMPSGCPLAPPRDTSYSSPQLQTSLARFWQLADSCSPDRNLPSSPHPDPAADPPASFLSPAA